MGARFFLEKQLVIEHSPILAKLAKLHNTGPPIYVLLIHKCLCFVLQQHETCKTGGPAICCCSLDSVNAGFSGWRKTGEVREKNSTRSTTRRRNNNKLNVETMLNPKNGIRPESSCIGEGRALSPLRLHHSSSSALINFLRISLSF